MGVNAATTCTICDKPITGIDMYGPLQWPLCWTCFGKHEQDVIDIIHSPDAMGQSKKHNKIKHEIHMLRTAEGRELLKETKEMQKAKARIEMLEQEIKDIKWELRRAKDELWKLEKKVAGWA